MSIVFNNFSFKYWALENPTLKNINLTINKGEKIALIGPSGAGKSSLLALIAGFLQPDSGDISIHQQSIITQDPAQRPLSMLFQEHNLFPHLTVYENIALGVDPRLKLSAQQQQHVRDAAVNVGLEAYLTRLPEQLSGGQRQRVALARCLIRQRPLLLLDEPFSALDPALRNDMLKLVQQLAQQQAITVLMITHSPDDAKKIANKCIFVDNGEVKAFGNTDTLLNQPQQLDLRHYLGLTTV